MIPLLLCLALLFLALPGTVVPVRPGVAGSTAPVLVEAFLRLAFSALVLLVRRIASGLHRDLP